MHMRREDRVEYQQQGDKKHFSRDVILLQTIMHEGGRYIMENAMTWEFEEINS